MATYLCSMTIRLLLAAVVLLLASRDSAIAQDRPIGADVFPVYQIGPERLTYIYDDAGNLIRSVYRTRTVQETYSNFDTVYQPNRLTGYPFGTELSAKRIQFDRLDDGEFVDTMSVDIFEFDRYNTVKSQSFRHSDATGDLMLVGEHFTFLEPRIGVPYRDSGWSVYDTVPYRTHTQLEFARDSTGKIYRAWKGNIAQDYEYGESGSVENVVESRVEADSSVTLLRRMTNIQTKFPFQATEYSAGTGIFIHPYRNLRSLTLWEWKNGEWVYDVDIKATYDSSGRIVTESAGWYHMTLSYYPDGSRKEYHLIDSTTNETLIRRWNTRVMEGDRIVARFDSAYYLDRQTGEVTRQAGEWRYLYPNSKVVTTEQPSALRLFPNPARSESVVSLSENQPMSIKLVDQLGRIVMQVESSSGVVNLNVAQLPGGSYLVIVKQDEKIYLDQLQILR